MINFEPAVIATQGIWAALFIWLFLTTRRESELREKRLMSLLECYGEGYHGLAEIMQQLAVALGLKVEIKRQVDEHANKRRMG